MAYSLQAARNLTFVFRLFVASMVFAGLQLALGADAIIVCLAVLTGVVCLIPVYMYGPSRTVGVIFIMIWYIFSFGELLTKSLLLQPVDSNLSSPLLTHVVMLAGAGVFSLAGIASLWFTPFKGDAIKPVVDPNGLTLIALILFSFFLVARALKPIGGDVWAVGKFFANVSTASIVCATAAVIIRTGGRRTVSILSLILGLVFSLDSVANNSKAGIMAVGFAYLLCRFSLGVRPSWRVYAAVAAVMAFVSISLYPAIHLARVNRDQLSPMQMATETLDLTGQLLVRDSKTVAEAEQMDVDSGGYNQHVQPYLGSVGGGFWVDRFIAAGYIDTIARRLNFDGPFLGVDFVLGQSGNWLPRQLNPNKDIALRYSAGDMIMRSLGMAYVDVQTFATVPMPVELFAAGGFVAVLLIGTPVLTLIFSVLNIMSFNFINNIWSVYLIMSYGYIIAIDTYSFNLFVLFRGLPADWVLLSVVIFVSALILDQLRRRPRALLTATMQGLISGASRLKRGPAIPPVQAPFEGGAE